MKKTLSIFIVLIAFFSTNAQDCLLDQKPVQDLVQDYAGILSEGEEQNLRQALIAFDDSTSTQILIVTVNDLCGYDKAAFTYKLGEKWGVGQDGNDNGIVIMVKPNGRQGDRHAFIATGYGLEGVLPDAIAKRIVENEMIPNFKKQNFYQGIASAANTVMAITSGEFSADDYNKKANKKKMFPFFGILLFIIVMMIFKVRQTKRYASTNGMTFWAAWALMNASRRSHRGSYGGFSSGSGGFGGGGFGGFGGGSFGGGGAGGSW